MVVTNSAKGYRRGRHIRSAITLLLLIGILGGAAWFGWQEVLGDATPDRTIDCTTPRPGTKQKIEAKNVVVNVYNAGRTTGLADDIAQQLRDRGFEIGIVANAEDEAAEVTKVRINGRANDAPEVQLLAAQVKKSERVPDGRLETEVDLIVGDEFQGLVKDGPSVLNVKSTVATCTTSTPRPEA